MKTIKCKKCDAEYEKPSEQSVCILLKGSCIMCNLYDLSAEELTAFQTKTQNIKNMHQKALRKAQEK
ncbi:hypothetical protein UFOVP11_63 [uncultured Caudovirales phage]|uniref:Uncharacterized protein n=1 Tax=uncultured Caudovirales phage TaxID=2100421 RepID=A0A6J5KMQ9_9CAUD|nr:hypothetical protein UFOVP11_63 [uncultured Caudovirales phage]